MLRSLPMFPLGTVLFPHMVLPLHVFEPRYRALMDDVLAGDRCFGVTLITRGHEVGGGDSRSDLGTVARVVQAEETNDGRWLVIAVGTDRVRVTRWLDDAPYPRAEVELAPEAITSSPEDDADRFGEVAEQLRRVLALQRELGHDGVPPTVELDEDPAIGAWQIPVFGSLTPFDAQRVLEADTPTERLELLGSLLTDLEQVLRFQLRANGREDPTDETER